EERASAGGFTRVADWHELLATWAAPIEKRWRDVNEIVTQYWGYLEQLQSPRPRQAVAGPLAPLTWPKPAAVTSKPASAMAPLPSVVERSDQFNGAEHAYADIVIRLDSLIEKGAKRLSRIRFWRRLPYLLYLLYGVMVVLSVLALFFFGLLLSPF